METAFSLEELLVEISTRFINIPYGDIDQGINETLETVGNFFEADRSYIIMLRQFELTKLDNTLEWCRAGVEPMIEKTQNLRVEDLQWWFDQMENGQSIAIPSVEKMPKNASNEKAIFQEQGILSIAGAPMRVEGRLIGFLGFDIVRGERSWRDKTIRYMEIIANILANILDRQRSETILRLSQQFQFNLNEIINIDTSKIGFAESLYTISDKIRDLIDSENAFIFFKTKEEDFYLKNGRELSSSAYAEVFNFLLSRLTYSVFVCQPNNEIHRDLFLNLTMIGKSFITIHLKFDEENEGLAILSFPNEHHFSPLEVAICEQASIQISSTLQKSLALEKSEGYYKELDALRATIADITSELELSRLLGTILERAVRLLGADGGDFCVFDPEDDTLQVVASRNISDDYNGTIVEMGEGAAGRCAQTRELIVIDDYLSWSGRLDKYEETGIRAALVAPMVIADRLLGTIGIFHFDPEKQFSQENSKLLAMLAQHAAIAMDNAMLFEKIQTMARTDAVTGLLNRRALLEMGEMEVKRSSRLGHPISVLMVDLDDFKEINDQFSHLAGDMALEEIALLIKQNLRTIDIVGRYGGDEFIILLPETDRNNAEIACQRLLEQIQKKRIKINGAEISITASIGYVSYEDDFPDVALMMNKADLAMYEVKNSGKNAISEYK